MPKIYACAKLNLALSIAGRFADGYHAVDMLMQEITLSDIVRVEKADKIRLSCNDVCPAEKNTAFKAAELFFKHTGIIGGADIQIEKRIPVQAGLGGGSSDAGAVLLALNVLYNAKLDKNALIYVGAQVGMDVPFFIMHGCVRVRGKGELLTRIENRLSPVYLIIKPEGGVSTKDAYKLYDEMRSDYRSVSDCADALENGDRSKYFKTAGNALYGAACVLNKNIKHAIEDAYGTGASFAMMTGSGSAVFAIYNERETRRQAFKLLESKYPFVTEAENF